MTRKLHSIQMLRAGAVLAILLHHLTLLNGLFPDLAVDANAPLFNEAFLAGYGGIDLFFVISGFVLIQRFGHMTSGFSASAAFLIGRMVRIFAPWWLALGAMMICYLIAYGAPFPPDRIANIGETGQAYILRSAFLLPSAHPPLLMVGSPLIHLAYLSLGFAALLLLPLFWRLIGVTFWTVLVLWGGLRGLSAPVAATFIEVFFHPLSLEFLGGMTVGILVRAKYGSAGVVMALMGVFSWALASQTAGMETDFMRLWGRLAYFGVPSFLLVWGFVLLERDRKLFYLPPILAGGAFVMNWVNVRAIDTGFDLLLALSVGLAGFTSLLLSLSLGVLGLRELGLRLPIRIARRGFSVLQKAIVYIGDLSYSLYLSHLPIYFLMRRIWPVLPANLQAWNTLLFAFSCLALTLLTASVIHSFFETPLRRGANQLRKRLAAPAGPVAAISEH